MVDCLLIVYLLSIVYSVVTERKIIYSFFSFSASWTKQYMMPAVTTMEARMVWATMIIVWYSMLVCCCLGDVLLRRNCLFSYTHMDVLSAFIPPTQMSG